MDRISITTAEVSEDDLGPALRSALERAVTEAEETLAARVAAGEIRRGARMNIYGELVLRNPAKVPEETKWPYRVVLRAGEGRNGRESITVLAPDGRNVVDVLREARLNDGSSKE